MNVKTMYVSSKGLKKHAVLIYFLFVVLGCATFSAILVCISSNMCFGTQKHHIIETNLLSTFNMIMF